MAVAKGRSAASRWGTSSAINLRLLATPFLANFARTFCPPAPFNFSPRDYFFHAPMPPLNR